MYKKFKNVILDTYKALQSKIALWQSNNITQAKILRFMLVFVSLAGIIIALYLSVSQQIIYYKIYLLVCFSILCMYMSKYLKFL
jgi:hypothetical protein